MGQYFIKIEQASEQGQDRASAFETEDAVVLLLADGSGGSTNGGRAAQFYVDRMHEILMNEPDPDPIRMEKLLRNIDTEIYKNVSGGETTALLIIIKNNEITGASAGDSKIWVFNRVFDYELTKHQYRKPLLGSSKAIPVGFGPFPMEGILIAGSDGLFNYTDPEKIKEKITETPFETVTGTLIDLVRLKSGKLQDDCSVISYTND